MPKYIIIAGVKAEIEEDSQRSALSEFVTSLPDTITEIRIDKASESNWQGMEEIEEIEEDD